jgi:integrase
MASIRIQSGKWQAIVRKDDFREVKTFVNKTAAKNWAKDVETRITKKTWISVGKQKDIDLRQIIQWSIDEAQTVRTFGAPKLASMKRIQNDIGYLTLDKLTVKAVMDYAVERRKTVKGSTLQQNLGYITQAIRRAKQKQNIPLAECPFKAATDLLQEERLTSASTERDRRPSDEELDILEHMKDGYLKDYYVIAIESALRQGEIHNLQRSDLDFDKSLMLIRGRKDKSTDEGRDEIIPMFEATREVLLRESMLNHNAPLTAPAIGTQPQKSGSVSDEWRKYANLNLPRFKDKELRLRFHDLRHEAISRLFEADWDIPEVAAVSGHRDWSQLKRYTNLKPENLLKKAIR